MLGSGGTLSVGKLGALGVSQATEGPAPPDLPRPSYHSRSCWADGVSRERGCCWRWLPPKPPRCAAAPRPAPPPPPPPPLLPLPPPPLPLPPPPPLLPPPPPLPPLKPPLPAPPPPPPPLPPPPPPPSPTHRHPLHHPCSPCPCCCGASY
ncbi:unnamed protein product [Closterium sp. NIES-53]